MKIVSTAVMSSMGPCGRNAVLGRFDRSPVVTNDGVTIAREISLQDPVENI
jgi:chaperonin GroEL